MKLLTLDIETSPHKVYSWGLFNQNISINQIAEPGSTLCWSAKWVGSKQVLFSKHTDKHFLSALATLLEEADAIITFNGKRFDLPTVNKEFIKAGMNPPAPVAHIDLYQVVRRKFRFASNKLDYVAQQLGLGAKMHHKGFDLWTGCMKGDKPSWQVMQRYNQQDVRLTEKLYKHLLPWITNHPRAAHEHEESCTNCGSRSLERKGFAYTQQGKYQRYQCKKCAHWTRSTKREKPAATTRSCA